MAGSLTIGDFSRVTFLSVKTLRHYHQVGLLEPADVDPVTGYRRYTSVQIPVAQVIRRFRDLGMPLHDIGSVLRAPDQTTRSVLIAAHLTRLEQTLAETPTRRGLPPRPASNTPSLSAVMGARSTVGCRPPRPPPSRPRWRSGICPGLVSGGNR